MLRPVRRVVTGQRAGRSTVVIDGVATNCHSNPMVPETGVTIIWKSDTVPIDNDGVTDSAGNAYSLHETDTATDFMVFQCAPLSRLQNLAADRRDSAWLSDDMLPKGTQTDKASHPGMHRHDTTDYITMLSGEITLILEDGEVTLRPGDTLINRGSLHAWENRGDVPAILTAASIGARPFS